MSRDTFDDLAYLGEIELIAVDPGQVTTGVAWVSSSGELGVFHDDEHDALCSVVFAMEKSDKHGNLIIEAWNIRPEAGYTAGRELIEAQAIGVLRWYCGLNGWQVFIQQPNVMAVAAGQARARDIKLIGQQRDERQAELHLLYYVLKQQPGRLEAWTSTS